MGGTGGSAQNHSNGGNGGNGSAAIIGSDLIIINAGTIGGGSGGAAGSGVSAGSPGGVGAKGNAITFTGGASTLTLQTGWVLNGDIQLTGSVTFNQSIGVTLSNTIVGLLGGVSSRTEAGH